MNAQSQTRPIETVHCLILGLSMLLVGLYFGTSIPAGVDLVALQTGLIGMLVFMGLTQIRIATQPLRQTETESKISRSTQVERRLERHIAAPHIQRIDRGRQQRRLVSVKRSNRTVGTVSVGTE
ncbi:MAG: hypothetical protein O3B13_16625 [Planctomycetota bacterium]|nr:hypothetical protein [Planctomycetota bacterium]MDA1164718.1 hypothetical protein [Planctomycetota bacterium]